MGWLERHKAACNPLRVLRQGISGILLEMSAGAIIALCQHALHPSYVADCLRKVCHI